MDITEIKRYKFDDKEYKDLPAVKTEIQNRIGEIIDYSDVTLTPKQKLNLFKAIVKYKGVLRNLLNVTIPIVEDSTWNDKNILDL